MRTGLLSVCLQYVSVFCQQPVRLALSLKKKWKQEGYLCGKTLFLNSQVENGQEKVKKGKMSVLETRAFRENAKVES